jgi:hypothetical protein
MATKEYEENLRKVLDDPETFERLLIAQANGGGADGAPSVLELCAQWKVRFSDVRAWLEQDERRKAAFERAKREQTTWLFNRVLDEVQKIATVDLRQAFDEKGRLKHIHDIPTEVARCISSIETVEYFEGHGRDREHVGVIRKIRFNDKLKALELAGKQAAMFKDHVEHSGGITLEELIEEADGQDRPAVIDRTKMENLGRG